MKDCLEKDIPDWETRSQEVHAIAVAASHEGFSTPLTEDEELVWIDGYLCAYDDIIHQLTEVGLTDNEIGLALNLRTWRDK